MTFRHRHFGHHRPWWTGPSSGPSMFSSRMFGPGEVRIALLSLLADGPKHGYELMKRLEDRSGGIYRASAGTIYPTLQQLEDEGLVLSEQTEGKRIYRLTDSGRNEVDRESEAIRRIWRRAEAWNDWRGAMHPDAAEVRNPAERLLKAAFRAAACGGYNERKVDKVRDILQRALRDLEALARDDRDDR